MNSTLSLQQKEFAAAVAAIALQMKLPREDAAEVFGSIMRVAAEYDVHVKSAPDIDTALAVYIARWQDGIGQIDDTAFAMAVDSMAALRAKR